VVLTIVDDVMVSWCNEMRFAQNALEDDATEIELGRRTVCADESDCDVESAAAGKMIGCGGVPFLE
jgi:hypothetical protein